MPRHALLSIFRSLITPYLAYGLIAWGQAYKSYLYTLLKHQKRARECLEWVVLEIEKSFQNEFVEELKGKLLEILTLKDSYINNLQIIRKVKFFWKFLLMPASFLAAKKVITSLVSPWVRDQFQEYYLRTEPTLYTTFHTMEIIFFTSCREAFWLLFRDRVAEVTQQRRSEASRREWCDWKLPSPWPWWEESFSSIGLFLVISRHRSMWFCYFVVFNCWISFFFNLTCGRAEATLQAWDGER